MALKWEYTNYDMTAICVLNPHIINTVLCRLERLGSEDIGLVTWRLNIWPDGTIKTITSVYYDTKQEALEDAEKALGGWFE